MVFYRKYRPQTISDLDSAKVRELLTSVLAKNPPHAFLFTGPKGLGKTSTARIVAKAVNCERRYLTSDNSQLKKNKKSDISSQHLDVSTVEPCNECESCISITNGTNLDVLEIDAASNRGIDEIRDLKEKIRLAPLKAAKKVYIIDEVHMLTTEAFNALLKTLEEPPEHALFVLCTTEPHKVPATILSRCFHIAFSVATVDELIRSFKRIAEGEKLDVEEDALREIAKLADGGFRDGAKILEEIATLANGQKITRELIEQSYHVTSVQSSVAELLLLFSQRDTKASLQLIRKIEEQGVDIKYFMSQLLDMLHFLLLKQIGVAESPTPLPEVVLLQAEISVLLHMLSQAYLEMKTAVIPTLPLELVIIEWGEASIELNAKGKEGGEVTVEEVVTTTVTKKKEEVSVDSLRKQVGNMAKIKALYGEDAFKKEESAKIVTTDVELLKYTYEGEITQEWLEAFWRCIIAEMKTHNHTIAGVLRGCQLKSFDRQTLVIETSFKFHKEKLDDGKTMQALQDVCKALWGKPLQVSIVLTSN